MKPLLPLLLVTILFTTSYKTFAQTSKDTKNEREGEFYFSWGYNTEWYTKSDVHVSQPSLGNDYTLNSVNAHDHRGWDEGLLSKALSIPQYNYRIGYLFNKKRGLGVEINFDHTKYLIRDGSTINVTGTQNGVPVNTNINFADANGYHYYLNNGANFLLFNFVKRWHWLGNTTKNFKLDLLAKAGVGPVIPHVDNSFGEGQQNHPHFQFGGWNTGIEGVIRATFYKYVYLEYCNKFDYARYSNLAIYQGTAKQSFGTYEMILNLGVTFPIGKKI